MGTKKDYAASRVQRKNTSSLPLHLHAFHHIHQSLAQPAAPFFTANSLETTALVAVTFPLSFQCLGSARPRYHVQQIIPPWENTKLRTNAVAVRCQVHLCGLMRA